MEVRNQLGVLGYKVATTEKPRDLGIKLFNALKRRVTAKPRDVHMSREISVPHECRDGFKQLKAKLTAGDDVTPHLSTRLLKADFSDALLNDWGIHHFHLEIVPHATKAGFVKRTDPVLLAHITDTAAYLIAVAVHDHWAEQRYLDILRTNWPELLVPFRVPGRVGSTISDKEVERLRKSGVNAILRVGDESYTGLGGGYVTSKAPADAVWFATKAISTLRRLQRHVKNNVNGVVEKLTDAGLTVTDPIIVRLRIENDRAIAIEHTSRQALYCTDFPHLAG